MSHRSDLQNGPPGTPVDAGITIGVLVALRSSVYYRISRKCMLNTYQGTRSIKMSYGVTSSFPMEGIIQSGLAFIFSTLGQIRYCDWSQLWFCFVHMSNLPASSSSTARSMQDELVEAWPVRSYSLFVRTTSVPSEYPEDLQNRVGWYPHRPRPFQKSGFRSIRLQGGLASPDGSTSSRN